MVHAAGGALSSEYRALRSEKGGFLDLVYDSEAAAEVTVQPLRRFDFDGAILFSDILIVPYAMGQHLAFLAGEGPQLSPPLVDTALGDLSPVMTRVEPIYATVRGVRALLAPHVTMLGFAGSAWTVATYMVAGAGSRDQHDARAMAYRDPVMFQAIIDSIVNVTVTYLSGQIEAGAEAVQLFDSWSGSLAPRRVRALGDRAQCCDRRSTGAAASDTPVIGFPKGAGARLPAYVRETGVHAVGIDETLDPVWVDANLPAGIPARGNLDPLLLLAGGPRAAGTGAPYPRCFRARPHIFNLVMASTGAPHRACRRCYPNGSCMGGVTRAGPLPRSSPCWKSSP